MSHPVTLPDLQSGDEPVRVSCWLVDVGDDIDEGDRVVEVLIRGITFDVSAPAAGRLTRIEKSFDMPVVPGDILGWIDVERGTPKGERGTR